MFPPHAAGFHRGKSIAYAPGMTDFSTAYNFFTNDSHIAATIYIFTATGSFENIFAAEHNYISNTYSEAETLGTWETKLEKNGSIIKAYRADYKYQTNFMNRNQEVFSQYMLWQHGEKFIKLRITSPFKEMDTTIHKALELIEAVKWDI